MDAMEAFLRGAIVMACAVAGMFFLRFWRQTHDRLFLIFALAFWLLGLARLAVYKIPEGNETHTVLVYSIRLVAFVLILAAIADKNRSRLPPVESGQP